MKESVPQEVIEGKIYLIRGYKVMLSLNLAKLYGVKAKALIQAVKRNTERFPGDFMFQLTWKEAQSLRSQFVTLDKEDKSDGTITPKRGKYSKYLPYAFTEHGVAMLSSVLNSKKAIQVNIAIMRAFAKLRQILSANKELARKLKELESKVGKHDTDIGIIFEAIRQLMSPPPDPPNRRIGFRQD